jgi:chromate reductase
MEDLETATRLLAISGSLRRESYNSALLRAAAAECGSGVAFVLWNGLDSIPAFNEDVEEPHAVARFKEEIRRADAILLATPEYNASVPGALKNALDWASRPFDANPLRGKPVAVIGASQGSFGAVRAQNELRTVLRTIGAHVAEHDFYIAHVQDAFSPEGSLRDPHQAAALRAILRALDQTGRKAA